MSEQVEEDFTLRAYVADHLLPLVLFAVCLTCVGSVLVVLGVGRDGALLVLGLCCACMLCLALYDYGRKAAWYRDAAAIARRADQARLFPELVKEPRFLEGRLAFGTACALARSSAREADELREEAEAYHRYVELWIHETKAPLAAAKLMLAGEHDERAGRIARELERIDQQVDQALYYARSTSVAQDYAIREVVLVDACREACKRCARLLIERGCTPAFRIPAGLTVLADEPWLVFILTQLATNAAKYDATSLAFAARVEDAGTPHGRTVLEVIDDGCGIPAADVPRVFERGFTGSVGRAHGSATGMGLYLVASLCAAMGLHVGIASEEGAGTRVILSFPHDRARAHLTQPACRAPFTTERAPK